MPQSKASHASKSAAVVQKRKGPSVPAAYYVAEEDADALDCGVCFLPLRPPIFQCEVGHVVCSSCRDKLAIAGGKCHVCGVTTGYRRCHAMDRLVESVRVPCPNAAHGCTATPPYHDRHGHRLACAHGPCHCPDEACGFTAGSTSELRDHFSSGVHGWPRSTHNSHEYFSLRLQDGFNVLDVIADDAADVDPYRYLLFLLNVTRQPLGRAVSVLWIHRRHAAATSTSKEIECELMYTSCLRRGDGTATTVTQQHDQKSRFRVPCTDLSNGLPSPDGCFQFLVPDCVVPDDDKGAITVIAQIPTH